MKLGMSVYNKPIMTIKELKMWHVVVSWYVCVCVSAWLWLWLFLISQQTTIKGRGMAPEICLQNHFLLFCYAHTDHLRAA